MLVDRRDADPAERNVGSIFFRRPGAAPAPPVAAVVPPLVSIIVTTHNYAEFVVACLKSVQTQTHDRLECIVVDDCSTDDTPRIVEAELAQWQDGRFSHLRLPRNVGQLAAQAEGFRRSAGHFVVFLDADDMLFPDFATRHLFVHHNLETAVGFTSSNQWTIARDGQLLAKHHTDLVSRVYSKQGQDVVVRDAETRRAAVRGVLFPFWQESGSVRSWVWGTQSTMMFRRPLLDLILPAPGNAPDSFRTCADFYLVRLGQLIGGSFVFREALGCYRRHGNNGFTRNGIIAARMQTGDMRAHPPTGALRALALQVFAERGDEFLSTLGQDRCNRLVRYIRRLPAGFYDAKKAEGPIRRMLGRIADRLRPAPN